MTKEQGIKVYHWMYDDGSKGYAVRQKTLEEKKWLDFSACSTKTKFRQDYRKLKVNNRGIPIKRTKYRIPGGLDSVQPGDFPRADRAASQAGLAAMKALLDSCGADLNAKKNLLNLVSAILAGYCTRSCCEFYRAEHIRPVDMRVPVIRVARFDYAYFVLEKIVRSMAVDTAVFGLEEYRFSEEPIKVVYRPVLPHKTSDRHIQDCAYLKLPGLKQRLFAQYRDTTLMIHCGFFSSSEILEFQRKNPWISLVLYGATNKMIPSTPIGIDGSILSRSNCRWENTKLRYMIERFVYYLAKKHRNRHWGARIERRFCVIERLISNYNTLAMSTNTNISPIMVSEKFAVSLQMLSLWLFLDSCLADGGIDKTEANELLKNWFNILFPGFCPTDRPMDIEEPELTPEPFQKQFESTLCKIIPEDEYSHIYFVPKGNYCPLNDPENNDLEYWGYIKWYQPRAKGQGKFLSLQFRRDKFDELFEKYCPNYIGKKWFTAVENLDVEYLNGTKARMYTQPTQKGEKQNSVDAIIINLDRADFFPAEIQTALQKIAGIDLPSEQTQENL